VGCGAGIVVGTTGAKRKLFGGLAGRDTDVGRSVGSGTIGLGTLEPRGGGFGGACEHPALGLGAGGSVTFG